MHIVLDVIPEDQIPVETEVREEESMPHIVALETARGVPCGQDDSNPLSPKEEEEEEEEKEEETTTTTADEVTACQTHAHTHTPLDRGMEAEGSGKDRCPPPHDTPEQPNKHSLYHLYEQRIK